MKKTRSAKAGESMAKSTIEMVHLMYQDKTALHFLKALHKSLESEIYRREVLDFKKRREL